MVGVGRFLHSSRLQQKLNLVMLVAGGVSGPPRGLRG